MTQKYIELPQFPNRSQIPVPNLERVVLDDLNFVSGRVFLASLNWTTELRVEQSYDGTLVVGFWPAASTWYGTLCEVKLPSIQTFNPATVGFKDFLLGRYGSKDGKDMDRQKIHFLCQQLERIANKMTTRCLEAMTHVDFVPEYIDGKFVENYFERQNYAKHPHGVVKPERCCPTNDLPGWPGWGEAAEYFSDEALDVSYLEVISEAYLAITSMGFSFNDRMDHYADSLRGHEGRRWQYRIHAYPQRYLKQFEVDPIDPAIRLAGGTLTDSDREIDVNKASFEDENPQKLIPCSVNVSTQDLTIYSIASITKSFEETYERSRRIGKKPYFLSDGWKKRQVEERARRKQAMEVLENQEE